MKRLLFLKLCFIFVLLLNACSDKENHLGLAESLTRLTNNNYKDWQLHKVTYLYINVTNQLPECNRDEIYRFYADGVGEIRSGFYPCTQPEPAVQTTGTWEFSPNGDRILIVWQDKQNWDVKIDKLNALELVVTGKVMENYEVTATFKPF